jgi:hypothetical protein
MASIQKRPFPKEKIATKVMVRLPIVEENKRLLAYMESKRRGGR